MSKETKHKITIPDKMENTRYSQRIIQVNGKKRIIDNGHPEFISIKDKNIELLQDGFSKIEKLAYSDYQLKSINEFFIENYRRLCELKLANGFQYHQWMVYKLHDDILFKIYEVWGADMTIETKKYLFPFLGGVVEVSEQIRFDPQGFGFDYQFHLLNEADDEKK